jgi:hypothetical protein
MSKILNLSELSFDMSYVKTNNNTNITNNNLNTINTNKFLSNNSEKSENNNNYLMDESFNCKIDTD